MVGKAVGAYTTNGDAIAAALMLGYPHKYTGGPNADFGMSVADHTRLRKEQL